MPAPVPGAGDWAQAVREPREMRAYLRAALAAHLLVE